jgi:hypothetical protein
MPNFFTELGRAVTQELAAPSGRYPVSPAARDRLSGVLRTTLDAHISRPPLTAKDQAMQQRMPRGPQYDQDDPAELDDPIVDCRHRRCRCRTQRWRRVGNILPLGRQRRPPGNHVRT